MAESINTRKLQQTSYLREVQQEKSARKRDLASQQQQDLMELRQHYADENKKVDQQSADAVNHIRSESKEIAQQYADDKRQQQEEIKSLKDQQRQARLQAEGGDSASASSTDGKPTLYNRQGQKKVILQNHEADKESDEFYHVQNRGSKLAEKSDHYVIEAYAPEHEKENIRVSVHRDKAVVSGKRKFGDSIEEGDKKTSTNNFQTFREEFKFNRPVSDEGMTRERFGDYVRFKIPKLEAIENPDENS